VRDDSAARVALENAAFEFDRLSLHSMIEASTVRLRVGTIDDCLAGPARTIRRKGTGDPSQCALFPSQQGIARGHRRFVQHRDGKRMIEGGFRTVRLADALAVSPCWGAIALRSLGRAPDGGWLAADRAGGTHYR